MIIKLDNAKRLSYRAKAFIVLIVLL